MATADATLTMCSYKARVNDSAKELGVLRSASMSPKARSILVNSLAGRGERGCMQAQERCFQAVQLSVV